MRSLTFLRLQMSAHLELSHSRHKPDGTICVDATSNQDLMDRVKQVIRWVIVLEALDQIRLHVRLGKAEAAAAPIFRP